ncbi:hypothetical protein ACLB2K_035438 [Fragaria x ananassa]
MKRLGRNLGLRSPAAGHRTPVTDRRIPVTEISPPSDSGHRIFPDRQIPVTAFSPTRRKKRREKGVVVAPASGTTRLGCDRRDDGDGAGDRVIGRCRRWIGKRRWLELRKQTRRKKRREKAVVAAPASGTTRLGCGRRDDGDGAGERVIRRGRRWIGKRRWLEEMK